MNWVNSRSGFELRWQHHKHCRCCIIIIINLFGLRGWSWGTLKFVVQRIRGFFNDMRHINSRFTNLFTYLHLCMKSRGVDVQPEDEATPACRVGRHLHGGDADDGAETRIFRAAAGSCRILVVKRFALADGKSAGRRGGPLAKASIFQTCSGPISLSLPSFHSAFPPLPLCLFAFLPSHPLLFFFPP